MARFDGLIEKKRVEPCRVELMAKNMYKKFAPQHCRSVNFSENMKNTIDASMERVRQVMKLNCWKQS